MKKSKYLKYLVLLLVFSFLFVGCGKKKEEAKPEPIPDNTPLLLEVTKEDSENKLYLFGSIHAADESMYPLPDYVMDAYKNSKAIAVEFDLIEYTKDLSSQMALLSQFVLPNGEKVSDYIDQERYNQGVEILKNAGLYSPVFDVYSPMFWFSLMENAAVLDADLDEKYGIDNYFLEQAKEDEKEIIELESAEYQYNLLSGFDYDAQVYLLTHSIDEYDEAKEALLELYKSYKEGNEKELEKLLLEESVDEYTKEYNDKLITIRNQNMAKSLEESLIEGKDVFCTVGLAHIIGEGGIADLLEQQGYTIQAIK